MPRHHGDGKCLDLILSLACLWVKRFIRVNEISLELQCFIDIKIFSSESSPAVFLILKVQIQYVKPCHSSLNSYINMCRSPAGDSRDINNG